MARPVKQGVDYFPLDVHMDDKFKFIEIKHGLEGFAIVIKLMQRIYSLGYWCKWTEDELLLFSDEIKSNPDKVQSVVNECLERDVFNKELHDNYNILTSTGIQKRYKEIVRRRKDVEVTEDYLLIDGISRVNDGNNPPNRQHDDGTMQTSSSHDDVKSTQRKGKESKGKEVTTRKYIYDDLHYKMATFFYEQILSNNPNHKKPNLESWANDVRKMMDIDGRSKDEIGHLMKWVQNNDFWMANVLSVSKLREKYDQLIMQYQKDKPKKEESKQFRPDSVEITEDDYY